MKVVFKNKNNQFFESISLNELECFQKILKKYTLTKEIFDAQIFAIDEVISSHQLENLKNHIEKLNLCSFHLFSNKRETILSAKSLKIDSTFLNENELKKRLFYANSNDQKDTLHKGTIRSGNRICSNGDLFIIGDVNPGAIVSAKKNIYVWGKLLGIALAGDGGNNNAFIASLYLNPLQLRINEAVAVGPKEKPKDFYPEIAILDKKSIIIKPYILKSFK